jgi:hypothetical protein
VSRALAVLVLALALVSIYVAMWRGWRRRAASQAQLPALPAALPQAIALIGPVEAIYVGTTSAGDWLDRIVVRSLGRRSQASVVVTAAGVVVDRSPEPQIVIPRSALREVRTDRTGAHRATWTEQLLVLTWVHGGHRLETVLRPRRHGELAPLATAAASLVPDEAAA